MDLYPIRDKNTKAINWHNLLLYAIIIVLVIFLWKSCHKPVTDIPVVKPSKEIVKEQADLTSVTKHIADSFKLEIRERDNIIRQKNLKYDDLLSEYLNQQNDIGEALNKPVPDTCKPIVAALNNQFNKLKKTSADKDAAANSLINSLKEQNETKNRFLDVKDTAIKKYISLLDTCTKSYAAIEKYVKKVQPKREVGIGVTALSGYVPPIKPVFGLQLYYRNKKANEISIGYYINNQISVGLKTRLFKF